MPFTLAGALRELAVAQPDRPCLTFDAGFGDASLTFADLDRRAAGLAGALAELGVRPGDRVAVLARNAPVFYELMFACSAAGAIMMALNWRLAPGEVAAILDDGRPTVLLVAEEHRGLVPADPAPLVVVLEDGYEAFLQSGDPSTPHTRTGEDDPVCLLYTSGTTGAPKGVVITNGGLSWTRRIAAAWAFTADSVNLVASPMFHIGGIHNGLMAMLQGGHTVLLPAPDPPAIVAALSAHRVTHAFFVPTVIQSIIAVPEISVTDLSSLTRIAYGASPMSDAVLLEAIRVLGCGFAHAYGMTETAGTVVHLPPEDHDPGGPRSHLLRSCGRPFPWVELALIDPATGAPVAVGEVGEVWIRSPMVTPGYWGKPEETAAAIVEGGWLRSGDAAYADADGYLYLHDRYKDMIVTGAENVYPAEVENVLASHPGVREVAVIGVPDERWGETVKAIVVPADDPPMDPAELISFARAHLARYKCPTSVDLVDALPRSGAGKVLKTVLREPWWAGRDRRIS